MKNPIKENRLVEGITFATRFLNFVKDIEVSDPCSEEERDAMINYAETLLKYQVRTAKDADEIDYLKKVGVYDKYQESYFVTKDGYTIYFEREANNSSGYLYSCMKEPLNGDQVLYVPLYKILNESHPLKNNRYYFVSDKKCKEYIEYHKPKYSEAKIKELELEIIKLKSKL